MHQLFPSSLLCRLQLTTHLGLIVCLCTVTTWWIWKRKTTLHRDKKGKTFFPPSLEYKDILESVEKGVINIPCLHEFPAAVLIKTDLQLLPLANC